MASRLSRVDVLNRVFLRRSLGGALQEGNGLLSEGWAPGCLAQLEGCDSDQERFEALEHERTYSKKAK